MPVPRYAVFGHPVAHSRSPRIHAAFAAQAGIELAYERIDAAPGAFAEAVAAFARQGGRGANVTLPHKPAALALCESVSERARRAGAVNTLLRLDDAADGSVRWQGDTTDGIGLVRDLRDRHRLALDGAHVLLLGAGGAGAGVAPALLEAGIARLLVANRSLARAQALAAHLHDPRVATAGLSGDAEGLSSDAGPVLRDGAADVSAGEVSQHASAAMRGARQHDASHAGASRPAKAVPRMHAATHHPFTDARIDLVINATSAARAGDAPWSALADAVARAQVAVDLGYGEAARPFLEFARGRGVARRIDGLGMLVEQAAESFRLWHGVMPATAPVYAELRAAP